MGKQLKGAIAGFGFISSKGHFPAYCERQDVEIIAVADICAERRELALSLNPKIKIYDSAATLLEKEKNLDFIDISTPPVDHASITLMALSKGVHVLCEKPITMSTVEAKSLLEAAQKYRRVVFPCHNYKHSPVVKTVDQIIESGEIGKVTGLTLNTFRNTHAKGTVEWKTDWRREKKYSGGGIAMDHGSHTFYLTFNWLKSYPTHVTAKMNKISKNWDTEDNFSCFLTFPNGYAVAHLTWTAGMRKVTYSVQATKGAVMIDDDDVQVYGPDGVLTRKFSIASHWGDASHVQWFNSMFDKFVKCIQESDFVNTELKEAWRCIEIIEKSYESSQLKSTEMKLSGV